jgi:hypothetical protein
MMIPSLPLPTLAEAGKSTLPVKVGARFAPPVPVLPAVKLTP